MWFPNSNERNDGEIRKEIMKYSATRMFGEKRMGRTGIEDLRGEKGERQKEWLDVDQESKIQITEVRTLLF